MFTFLLDIKGFLTAPDVMLFRFSFGVNVRNGQIDPNKPFPPPNISHFDMTGER